MRVDERVPFLLLVAFAVASSGCSTGLDDSCDLGEGGAPSAALLVVGELRTDVFTPLADLGEATLVRGSQGSDMLLLVVQVPSEWRSQTCLLLTIEGRLARGDEVAPANLRLEPARYVDDAGRIGPLPFVLGTPGAYDDATMEIHVVARTRAGVAEQTVSVVLRRRA